MRNLITLFALATLSAACADDGHPTALASHQSPRPADGGAATLIPMPAAQGKPIDQVGFTKLTGANGPGFVHVKPGDDIVAVATCPEGTIAIGGGYKFTLFIAGSVPPRVMSLGPNAKNGWEVRFNNDPVGAGDFTVVINALCIS